MNVTQKPHLHQDWIDPHAIGIVRALQKQGFTTYLVGGCVRDLLLGIHPKDFDIATTAKPDQVRSIIHRAYVIGKRFRLVLVRRDAQQFEVATFRREIRDDEDREALPSGDNVFGSPEEDARRRDFTINGLFYDPIGNELIDFAEGLPDLEHRLVRMIGEPEKRLIEDPIRILRALRLKHMIGFSLEPELREAIVKTAPSLAVTALPRRREEILKWLRLKNPDLVFREAFDLGVLRILSPALHHLLETSDGEAMLDHLRECHFHIETGPTELFAKLIYAFARSSFLPNPLQSSRGQMGLDDEKFQTWMRDELGVFKLEQAQIVKALHVEPLLAKRKEFQARGERRQKALLSNPAFPLALEFARLDHLLSGEDLHYWRERRLQFKDTDAEAEPRRRKRRPRRRRKEEPA